MMDLNRAFYRQPFWKVLLLGLVPGALAVHVVSDAAREYARTTTP